MTTRRNILKGSAVLVAAAVGYPAIRTIAWRGNDWTKEGYSDEYPVAKDGHEAWRNWGGNQVGMPKQILDVSSEEELANLIRNTDGKVRPAGSGHSFTALLPTDGVMVRLNGMSGLYEFDERTGDATFGAGTLIYEAAELLHEKGRALENLPDINVQSLAGAFSTGTHGTGGELTAMHDYIKSFRIVTADGNIRDVTKSSDPQLFSAGKVSLGALGVITQYTLRTVPSYRLLREVYIMKNEEMLARWDEFSSEYRNFEVFLIPGTTRCAVLLHDVTERTADFVDRTVDGDDEEILEGLKLLRDNLGWSPTLRGILANTQLPVGLAEKAIKASHEILTTERSTPFIEMEYHIPEENSKAVVKAVIEKLNAQKDIYFPAEIRQIGSDDAMISPFNGGKRMSIAIHSAPSEDYDYFFNDFEPMYLENGGRPHWGKVHSLDKSQLTALYPNFEEFLAVRRKIDPSGKFLNEHLANMFGERI